ncbi:S8 family peptidase [Fimbriimonas ginsengisoli]|uniref:Serine protease n=1 Tax=Fimbriimonas ginsengisoli Gsoil 348 TaxID=661478 RepID=A0A068NMQ9_FIMGI|nr:S8 family serine peptidase [Fimbriimonas ginsengisoli]AIE84746.1 serine protease [Fimbriimonas ginsengisoli Gsoil 348]
MTSTVNRIFLLLGIAAALVLPTHAAAESLLICQLTGKGSAAGLAKKYGVTLKDTTDGAPFALFSTPTRAMADSVHALMALDKVNFVWAEDDGSVGCPEAQSKSTPSKGGGLPAVGDRKALQAINKNLLGQINWSPALANLDGRSVRVAVLDNGLSPKQPALWAKVDASLNAIEPGKPAYDQPMGVDSNKNGKKDEALGHGTMVAGIIDQIAPKTRFVIARIADSDGNASAWTLIKGLAFAVTQKAEVANVSLGSLAQVVALTDAMDWCEQNRLLVVAAIGNDGLRAACFPARISKVVCVSGVDQDNHKASFSNWEGTADAAAPATGFASQFWDGSIAVWNGTSFAVPVVTASIADCLRRIPANTPSTMRKALTSSGTKIDGLNPKYKGELGMLVNYTKLDQALRKP